MIPQPPTGAPKPKRGTWLPWILSAIAIVVFAGLLAAVAGDWYARNTEMRTLVERIESTEAVMGAVQDSIAITYAESGQQDWSDQQLEAELKKEAQAGVTAIGESAHAIHDVTPLPWHTEAIAAKRAYLTHTAAWLAYLNAASTDPTEFERDQPEVDDTFLNAKPILLDAVPEPELFDLRQRIELIYVVGTDSDSESEPSTEVIRLVAQLR